MRPSEALNQHRQRIREIVSSQRATNPRVFGSVLHHEDTDVSDLDLLVDPLPQMTYFNIGAIVEELENLLKVKVDVLTPRGLPVKFREQVVAEAMEI